MNESQGLPLRKHSRVKRLLHSSHSHADLSWGQAELSPASTKHVASCCAEWSPWAIWPGVSSRVLVVLGQLPPASPLVDLKFFALHSSFLGVPATCHRYVKPFIWVQVTGFPLVPLTSQISWVSLQAIRVGFGRSATCSLKQFLCANDVAGYKSFCLSKLPPVLESISLKAGLWLTWL